MTSYQRRLAEIKKLKLEVENLRNQKRQASIHIDHCDLTRTCRAVMLIRYLDNQYMALMASGEAETTKGAIKEMLTNGLKELTK